MVRSDFQGATSANSGWYGLVTTLSDYWEAMDSLSATACESHRRLYGGECHYIIPVAVIGRGLTTRGHA